MARHTFKLSTVSRAIRAARNVGAPVERVEISATGSVILHMVKPAGNAPRPTVKQPQAGSRTST